MILSTIWSIFTMLIDVCIVWCMVYYILKNVKNNSKMILIVKGVIIILIFKLLSEWLSLY
jgi:diadenylate cyclase